MKLNYRLTDTDIELGGEVILQGLKNNGYQIPNDEVFSKQIKEIFETQENCLCTSVIQHQNFTTYIVNLSQESNIDETEFDYTYNHIFVYPKFKILSDVPLLNDFTEINDNQLKINLDQHIIARNKYLFNNSKGDLVWLLFNDKDFLKNLLVVFGYDKEDNINEFVVRDLYNQYFEEIPESTNKIGNLIFVKNCENKLVIRKGLLNYIEKFTTKDDKYISALSLYIITELYNREKKSIFTDVEKAEIVANISNIEIPALNKFKGESSQAWRASASTLFYLQSKNAMNHPEVLDIMKKVNYFGFDFLKKYIESGELQDEMPNNIDGGEGLLDIEKEQKEKDKKLHLYDRPDFSSFSKEILAKGEIEIVHQNLGWNFVKVNDMTGYLPTDEKREELRKEEKKKFSFLAEEEDMTPEKKKKGFWNNLFG